MQGNDLEAKLGLTGSPPRAADQFGYVEFMNVVINTGLVGSDSGELRGGTAWLPITCMPLRPTTVRHGTFGEDTNWRPMPAYRRRSPGSTPIS